MNFIIIREETLPQSLCGKSIKQGLFFWRVHHNEQMLASNILHDVQWQVRFPSNL
jgi:hypothetical protein